MTVIEMILTIIKAVTVTPAILSFELAVRKKFFQAFVVVMNSPYMIAPLVYILVSKGFVYGMFFFAAFTVFSLSINMINLVKHRKRGPEIIAAFATSNVDLFSEKKTSQRKIAKVIADSI